MKKSSAASIIIVIRLAAAYYAYDVGLLDQFIPNEPENPNSPAGDTVTVAAFNIQIFGVTKRARSDSP